MNPYFLCNFGIIFYFYREECGDPICQPVFWCKQCSGSNGGSIPSYGQQTLGTYGASGSALSPTIGSTGTVSFPGSSSGSQDSYGIPQGAPISGGSSSASSSGSQDSYGIPQGAPIGGGSSSGSSSGAQDSYGIPQGAPINPGSSSGSSGQQDSYGIPQGSPVGGNPSSGTVSFPGSSSGSSSASDSYGTPSNAAISPGVETSVSNYGSPQILSGTSSVVKSGPSPNPLLNSGASSSQGSGSGYSSPSVAPAQQSSNGYGSPQASLASPISTSYGSAQGSPSPQPSPINPSSNSYGSPSVQPAPSIPSSDSYGSPSSQPPSINPPSNAYGSPQASSVSPVSSSYGSSQSAPAVQPSPAQNSYGSPQNVPISNAGSASQPSFDSYGSPGAPSPATSSQPSSNNYGSPPNVPFVNPTSSAQGPSNSYGSPPNGVNSAPISTSYGSSSSGSLPSGEFSTQSSQNSYGSPSFAPSVAPRNLGTSNTNSGGSAASIPISNNYVDPLPVNVPSSSNYDSPSSGELPETLGNSLSASYNANTLGVASSATGDRRLSTGIGSGSFSSGQSNPITFSPSPSTVPFGILKGDDDKNFLVDYSLGSKSNNGEVTPSFPGPSVLPPPDKNELDQLTPVNSHPYSIKSNNNIEGSGDDFGDIEVVDVNTEIEDDDDDFSNLIPGDYIDDSYGEIDPDQIDDSIDSYKPQQDTYQSLSSDFDYSYADSFTQYHNDNLMIDLRGRSRSDKNYGAPDLVVDNSAPFSYGEGSRRIRFR